MSKSFILYNSWYEAIKQLPADEKGMLLDAMFQFHITGEIPKLSPTANMAFNFIKPVFEENKTKYENKCKANRENINKRWKKEDTKNTSGKNDNTKNTNGINGKISYSDNYNENENENKERESELSKKPFTPPQYNEVLKEFERFFRERNLTGMSIKSLSDKFFSHYEGNGWMTGPNQIKNWKAQAYKWFTQEKEKGNIKPKPQLLE